MIDSGPTYCVYPELSFSNYLFPVRSILIRQVQEFLFPVHDRLVERQAAIYQYFQQSLRAAGGVAIGGLAPCVLGVNDTAYQAIYPRATIAAGNSDRLAEAVSQRLDQLRDKQPDSSYLRFAGHVVDTVLYGFTTICELFYCKIF